MSQILESYSIDTMEMSKDHLDNPKSVAEINNSILAIKRDLDPEYVCSDVPFNTSADALAARGSNFAIEPAVYAKRFTDAIVANGMKVHHRPTDCAFEGIYNFPKLVGSARIPVGTLGSAPTDGTATWMGRVWRSIVNNPTIYHDGDKYGAFPEGTGQGIFNDATAFVPNTGAGVQANFASFYVTLKAVAEAAFASIGKKVICGESSQNFSEVRSGWMNATVHVSNGCLIVDHYGTQGAGHSPTEMKNDLRAIKATYGLPVELQEWGDYWSTDPQYGFNRNQAQHEAYLDSMYAAFQELIDEGTLIRMNYWRATGGTEAVFYNAGSNGTFDYQLNYAGLKLKAFFNRNHRSLKKGFLFDGLTGYNQIADNSKFSPVTTGKFSVAFTLRPDVLNNLITSTAGGGEGEYVHFLGKGEYASPNQEEWVFRMYNKDGGTRPNRISFYIFNSNGGLGVGSYFEDVLVAGQKIRIVGTIDGTNTKIYRDGVLRDTDQYSGTITPADTTAPVRMGRVEAGSDPGFLKGLLSDIIFYDYDLRAVDVQNDALGAPRGDYFARYTGNDGNLLQATDLKGSYNGVPHGGVSYDFVNTPQEVVNPNPDSPTNLVATVLSESSIQLDWTDNSNNESGFSVERKVGSGGTYEAQPFAVVSDDFESYVTNTQYADLATFGPWVSRFNGFGVNKIASVGGDKMLRLTPQVASAVDGSDTHAALVTGPTSDGDVDITVRMKTVSQLRTNHSPNAWERGWILWNYIDNLHFYYFVLKATGWELGKEDPAYSSQGNQNFLATGASPTFAVGVENKVRITQVGSTIKVWVDDVLIVTYTDAEAPLYTTGKVGLYTEDADVLFDDVVVIADNYTVEAGVTRFVDTGLTPNTNYYYQVRAFGNSLFSSAYTNEVNKITLSSSVADEAARVEAEKAAIRAKEIADAAALRAKRKTVCSLNLEDWFPWLK